jgi:hypothetical protein
MKSDGPDLAEHNVTGVNYADRRHFCYAGPLIDVHATSCKPTWPVRLRGLLPARAGRQHRSGGIDARGRRGLLELPVDMLQRLYHGNARSVIGSSTNSHCPDFGP